MTVPSRDKEIRYWTERFTVLEEASHKTALERLDAIDAGFRQAGREIEQEMSVWYQRFATNNGISLREAKQWLNAGELKEFKWTVQDYIKHGKENGITADWSKELENASARFHVSRLQALEIQSQQVVEKLFGNQLDGIDQTMRDTYLRGYYHTAYETQRGISLGWNIGKVDQGSLDRVINTPWTLDGRTFSDRIWTNKAALNAELRKQITQNLMLGKSPQDSIAAIQAKFNVTRNQAARIVMTETAYFSSVSQGDCWKALGVQKVQIVATLDDRTSDICRDMDGTVIDMKDYSPGSTVPPFHPYCRSVTAPYYADMEKLGERAARDPETGKTYYVPRDMTYHDWEKTFVGADTGTNQPLPPTGTNGILGIASCKTVGEVEKFMQNQNWFRVGSVDHNQRVSLAGCDLETAKGIAEAYEQVFDEYPVMKGRIDHFQMADLDVGTYAHCYIRSGGMVEANKKYFNDVAKLAQSYTRNVSGGFHPQNTNWKSIITHEVGHAVDGTLTNLGLGGLKSRNSYDYKDVSAMMRPQVMKTCGLKVADTQTEVSGYATKNNREWFAECFAELLNSPSPRKVAVEFGKQLAEIILKVK